MQDENKWFINGCLLMGLLSLCVAWLWLGERGRLARQHLELGKVFQRAGSREQALQSFESAVRFHPRLAEAHYGRARLLLRDEPVAAEAAVTRALELGLERGAVYRLRGDARVRLERLEEALSDYGRALELDPKDALGYEKRGGALFLLDRPGAALADYNQALRYSPHNADLYHNRSLVHRRMGNRQAAIRDARIARELGL